MFLPAKKRQLLFKPNGFFDNVRVLIFVLALCMCGWFGLSYVAKVNPVFIPPPHKTLKTLLILFTEFQFWKDMIASWYRVIAAFVLSVAVAYPLVIIALLNENFKRSIFLIIEFFRYLPVPVFIPLAILWFGVDNAGKIVIVFLGTFAQMVPLYYDSAMLLQHSYTAFPASLKWSRKKHLQKVIVPGSLPYIWDNSRICFGWAWTYVIIAELVGAQNGLGYAIIRAQRYLATDRIFAYIIVIGLIGVLSDRLMSYSKKRLFKWV